MTELVPATSEGNDRARAFAAAGVIVIGPAPPLRGGIAAHTAGLVAAMLRAGIRAEVASWRRLYPEVFFPGRRQTLDVDRPRWCHEVLDVLGPRSWAVLGRELGAARATVVVQWWHPAQAPAVALSLRAVAHERVVAICHNVLPHEALPGSGVAARAVLGRAGLVICHSRHEADRLGRLLGAGSPPVVVLPLPCLLDEELLAAAAPRTDLASGGVPPRTFVAAGHLRPYKAVDLLLEAWLRARRPAEARLVVAGESYLGGRDHRRVLDLAASDPSIVLLNRYVADEELASILASAEVLVAAYRRASQSGMLALAAALGVASIVSDAGGLAEQAGDGARVVRSGDVADLTVALEEAFARPPRPRAAGVTALRSTHGGDAFSRPWQALIEAIVSRPRPSAAPPGSAAR